MTESKPFYTRLDYDGAGWCRGPWIANADIRIQKRPDFPGVSETVYRRAEVEFLRVDDARRLVADGSITLVGDACQACKGTGRAGGIRPTIST